MLVSGASLALRFVSLLRRHYFLIKAVGLALAAAFAASALMTTIATQVALDVHPSDSLEDTQVDDEVEDAEEPVAPSSNASSTRRAQQTTEDILAYNVFCPTCEPEADAPEAVTSPAVADAPMPTIALRLVATMESDDPAASLATLYDPERGRTGVFSVGETVLPGAIVAGIGHGVIAIDTAAGQTLLRVGEEPVLAAATTPSRTGSSTSSSRRAASQARASSSLPGASDAISCTGDDCTVEREFVESLMSNPASLATQAAVRPTAEGFQLTRVRSGTLPALLGLQSGDILAEVNGERIDSIDKALSLATKLRNATNLRVTVLRRGKTVSKRVEIS